MRNTRTGESMHPVEALQILKSHRTEEVVVSTMGSSREWLKISQHPRDFIYVPSAMGQAPTLGLGLALAQPQLRVVVLNGDGCMLMNLGCLVTIAEQAPPNYTLIVFQNGVYEVTGAQPVAGAGRIDLAGMAKSAGFRKVFQLADPASWQKELPGLLRNPGPIFAVLEVDPVTTGEVSPRAPCPMPDQIRRFMESL